MKHAASRCWSNIIFASDATLVVDDALSNKIPRGSNTSTSLRNIKLLMISNNWILEWINRLTNRLAYALPKLTLSLHCNFIFTWDNLDRILDSLLDIYASEIVVSLSSM